MRRLVFAALALLFWQLPLVHADSVTVNIPAPANSQELTIGSYGLVAGELFYLGAPIGTATFINYAGDSPAVVALDILTLQLPGIGAYAIVGERLELGEPSVAVLVDATNSIVLDGKLSWSLDIANSTFIFEY